MTLDKKLSRLRKKEGLSQAEVAERLDLSRQAVSRWESGEAKPSTDNFQALCKLYHVSMDYLLNESEDELPAPAPATESRPKRDTQRKALDQMDCNWRSRFSSAGVLPFLGWKPAEGRCLGFAFDSRRR